MVTEGKDPCAPKNARKRRKARAPIDGGSTCNKFDFYNNSLLVYFFSAIATIISLKFLSGLKFVILSNVAQRRQIIGG